jgi:hypothetical protein
MPRSDEGFRGELSAHTGGEQAGRGHNSEAWL